MSAIKAVTLTASIENEDAIRQWMESVATRCRALQADLDALSVELREAPHIAIHLQQDKGRAS